jgi:TonB family protein
LCSAVQGQEPGGTDLGAIGSAVYTETARDIFIASIRMPPGSAPENFIPGPPPKAMEYRIATRRLSSRGFSGMILLLAELGSGMRAPDSAVGALNVVKRRLKGALKRGDGFDVLLNEDNETVFLLNGVELHRVKGETVFEFLSAGWLGDGAATTFRNTMLAGNLNTPAMESLKALRPSQERVALVRGWVTDSRVDTGTIAMTAANHSPQRASPVIDASFGATAAGNPFDSAVPEPTLVESQDVEGSLELAAAAPIKGVAAAMQLQGYPDIDDKEYRQQLQQYVHQVMRQVYEEVKYPRRAIKYSWEGRVELSARLDKSGGLLAVTVDSSSGHGGLDTAAEAAVRRAAPFPELTPVAREELLSESGNDYVMSIPVTFALRR